MMAEPTELNKQVQFLELGRTDYQECWDFQTKLFDGVVATKVSNRASGESKMTTNYLIFCEHPHVYTLGKSGDKANLLIDEKTRDELGVSYYPINRGGDITYHGPGQLVGYPILDLSNFFTDIHKYLRLLEEAVIRTCDEYGLNATRIDGLTGVWIDADGDNPRKICALGVKASRWVTMHGFAFNINTDISYFEHIIPCGIDDKAVTSLKLELGREVDMAEVSLKMKNHLGDLFEFEFVDPS